MAKTPFKMKGSPMKRGTIKGTAGHASALKKQADYVSFDADDEATEKMITKSERNYIDNLMKLAAKGGEAGEEARIKLEKSYPGISGTHATGLSLAAEGSELYKKEDMGSMGTSTATKVDYKPAYYTGRTEEKVLGPSKVTEEMESAIDNISSKEALEQVKVDPQGYIDAYKQIISTHPNIFRDQPELSEQIKKNLADARTNIEEGTTTESEPKTTAIFDPVAKTWIESWDKNNQARFKELVAQKRNK